METSGVWFYVNKKTLRFEWESFEFKLLVLGGDREDSVLAVWRVLGAT